VGKLRPASRRGLSQSRVSTSHSTVATVRPHSVSSDRKLCRICLTPTRNESWIIKRFLAAARLWADHIVVADQGSTDGTFQELLRTPGVHAVVNASPVFDEPHRQRLLIENARRIADKRLLIALDADEALSSNCLQSKEWEQISQAEPGTVLRFRWVNVLPGFENAWIPSEPLLCGLVDDGTEHTGRPIHNPRVPSRPGAPVIDLQEIVVLHFQYVVPSRMRSKHRWYQAWEHLNSPSKRPLDIFRQYHHMHGGWDENEIQPVKREWFAGYESVGLDFSALASEPVTWWDKEVVQMLCQHGPARFCKLAIWDQDWNALRAHVSTSDIAITDPRSLWEKTVHRILSATQTNRSNWGVRGFEKLLRVIGW